jgi:hypothetical protein
MIMPKVHEWKLYRDNGELRHHQYIIWCEGCGYEHAMNPSIHNFNGDINNPTFTPSLLNNFNPAKVCHSFVTDGKIQYLDDSFHHLAGKTVELLDVDEMLDKRKKESKANQ